MTRTTKLFILLGAAAPLVVALAATEPAANTNAKASTLAATGETVIAKGKGISVTRGQLDQELIRIKTMLAAQGRSLPDDSAVTERQILDSLIGRQLLLAQATPADKVQGKKDFEKSLEDFKKGRLTEEEFNQKLDQQLKVLGLTKEEWQQQQIEQATLPIILERELSVKVTPDQTKKFYDDNPGKFEQPEMVRAAHILLMTKDPVTRKELSEEQKAAKKKELEGILKRARAGEDFAKLAKEYSEDPGSKDRGGEYTFPRGQMAPAFEAAAFSLNTNQISDIVTTQFGYHIIKLYEKIPAKMVDFDKVAPEIKDYLVQQDIKDKLPDYVEKLKKDAGVKILDERLNAVDLPDPAALSPSDSAPKPEKN
jgi:peptidyl-prolyl cis-trans isomerase C